MDRENVIKGLEELEGFLFKEYTEIKAEESKIYYDRFKSLSDAIDMLKEKEAVKPKSKVRHGAYAQIQHFCGNCNTMLHGKPRFCSECGKEVKWK